MLRFIREFAIEQRFRMRRHARATKLSKTGGPCSGDARNLASRYSEVRHAVQGVRSAPVL